MVIMLAIRGERCLLGRQAAWPKGMWSALAGFVEPGESLEDAVAREVLEETGILTGTVKDLSQFNFATQTLSLDIDDVYGADDVVLRAVPSTDAPIEAQIFDAQTGALAQRLALAEEGDDYVARTKLPPGSYRAKVTADFPGEPVTVTETFLTVDGSGSSQ